MPFTPSAHSQRLLSLMGTDEVRITDKRYMDKLKKRLQVEYEVNLKKREEALALTEVKREKELILQGKIPCPYDVLEKKQRKVKHKRKRSKKRKSSKGSNSGASEGESSEGGRKRSIHASKGRLSRRSSSRRTRKSEEQSLSCDEITQMSKQNEGSEEEATTTESSDIVDEAITNNRHYNNPNLIQFMQAETVHEMYALADDLVGK
ncbi:uncharacterized protein LOC100375317 [Saccoglossus kowalevskii]|uniref:CWF19-like protein 2 homolog isoform X1 n=1 Tax=Saccoglossus kowalevskii TaxID=10224 RepID=A0ABM0M673_SACKO|nr:PREDICTED: CWF19-like protein 2 homolog isoform X1 [Saccoglossus kowalevskii]XP_006815514.1 PREDICTED: CWF19-like protein 2 homolog isoform X2 [Saccoglossus kowalevskii]